MATNCFDRIKEIKKEYGVPLEVAKALYQHEVGEKMTSTKDGNMAALKILGLDKDPNLLEDK